MRFFAGAVGGVTCGAAEPQGLETELSQLADLIMLAVTRTPVDPTPNLNVPGCSAVRGVNDYITHLRHGRQPRAWHRDSRRLPGSL